MECKTTKCWTNFIHQTGFCVHCLHWASVSTGSSFSFLFVELTSSHLCRHIFIEILSRAMMTIFYIFFGILYPLEFFCCFFSLDSRQSKYKSCTFIQYSSFFLLFFNENVINSRNVNYEN